jgi:chromosome partitioning protein
VSAHPHRIVFANEKGGTGKSTTAVHVAIALAYQGAKRGRDRSRSAPAHAAPLSREPRRNRKAARHRRCPARLRRVQRRPRWKSSTRCCRELARAWISWCSTRPGRDDPFARHVATAADTLVTPLNDSFVDFDLIGQVDAETFKVRRLSFYAELIWEARKKRAMATIREQRREMDWVVVRNRTQHTEARNMRRLDRRADRTVQAGRLSASPTACPNA